MMTAGAPTPPPIPALPVANPKSLDAILTLRGDPAAQRDTLRSLLTGQGWLVILDPSGWDGKACRGNKVLYAVFGALAQYFEVQFQFRALGDGQTALRLYRSVSGFMGGLIGAHRVRKSFRETVTLIEHFFAGRGELVASTGR